MSSCAVSATGREKGTDSMKKKTNPVTRVEKPTIFFSGKQI